MWVVFWLWWIYSINAHPVYRDIKFTDDFGVESELKELKGFFYDTHTLYAGFKVDKKYITIVPIHINENGNREPAFDKAKWYETASTTEITGELDTDELKSYFYKIDIINADE